MKRITINAPATVIACIALAVALSGTSYAAFLLPKNSVGTAQIRNGAVTKTKINKKTIAALKGSRGPAGPQGPQGVKGDPGAQGVKGDPGAQGVQGAQGIQGVPGTARAYGEVSLNGTLSRSKNVTGVTNPTAGKYCIALAGIDASKTGLVATPDFDADNTSFGPGNANQALVEWRSGANDCPTGQLEVLTGIRSESTTGSSDGDVRDVNNRVANQAFFFVVP